MKAECSFSDPNVKIPDQLLFYYGFSSKRISEPLLTAVGDPMGRPYERQRL
jgi:hypothetical protein